MTDNDWPIDAPITYSTEEDDDVTEDEPVADNLALPGHPLYPSEDIATDSIPEETTGAD